MHALAGVTPSACNFPVKHECVHRAASVVFACPNNHNGRPDLLASAASGAAEHFSHHGAISQALKPRKQGQGVVCKGAYLDELGGSTAILDLPDNLDAIGSKQGRLPPRVAKLLAHLDQSGPSAAVLLSEGELLSTKELILLASHLPSLSSLTSTTSSNRSSTTASSSSSSSSMHAASGVGLLLGMINARDDVGACLQGDPTSVCALACLMYMASTAGQVGSWEVEATSIAAASARLRWPCLLQAVCEEAAQLAPGMAPQQLAEVLSCQACCSYATEAGLLVPLVRALWASLDGPHTLPGQNRSSPNRSGRVASPPWPQPQPPQPPQGGPTELPPSSTVQAVSMGLRALCRLRPCLAAPVQQAVRTLLESLAQRAAAEGRATAASWVHTAPPAVLLALSRCCWVYGCAPQSGLAVGVLQRAAESAQSQCYGAAQQQQQQQQQQEEQEVQEALAAAAGLLLPGLDCAGDQQGVLQLVDTLLQYLTVPLQQQQQQQQQQQGSSLPDLGAAAVAFYTAALASSCSSPPLLAALTHAAQEARHPILLALALRTRAAAGCSASECQAPLEALAQCVCEASQAVPPPPPNPTALCHAAIAVGQARLHSSPAGHAILTALADGMGAAGAGSCDMGSVAGRPAGAAVAAAALSTEQLVELAHAFAWQLVRPAQPGPAPPVPAAQAEAGSSPAAPAPTSSSSSPSSLDASAPAVAAPAAAAARQQGGGERHASSSAARTPALAHMALAALATRPKHLLAHVRPQQLHGVAYSPAAPPAAPPVLRMVPAGGARGGPAGDLAAGGVNGGKGRDGWVVAAQGGEASGAAEGGHAPLLWLLHAGEEGLWAVHERVGWQALDLLWVLNRMRGVAGGAATGHAGSAAELDWELDGAGEAELVEAQWRGAGLGRNGGSVRGSAAAAAASLMALLASSPVLLRPWAAVRALAAVEGWGPQLVGLASCPPRLQQVQQGERADLPPLGSGTTSSSSSGGGGRLSLQGPDSVLGGALLLQVASLTAWGGLGSRSSDGDAVNSNGSGSSSSSRSGGGGGGGGDVAAGHDVYTPDQLARLARSFGRVRWRPGALLRDLVGLMRSALRDSSVLWDKDGNVQTPSQEQAAHAAAMPLGAAAGPVHAGADAPPQRQGSGALSMHQAVWFAWGLARMERHTPSARAYVRDCVYSVLELRGRQGSGAGKHGRTAAAAAAAAASSSSSSSSKGGGGDELSGPEGQARATATAELATLLWVGVRMRMARDPCLLPLIAGLVRAPPLLDLRLAANVAWSAARLGMRSARLSGWVEACAVPRLQAALAARQQGQQQQQQGTGAGASLGTLTPPQALSNLCWGLQRTGHSPSPQLVSLVVQCSAPQLDRFKPHELSSLLFALAKWDAAQLLAPPQHAAGPEEPQPAPAAGAATGSSGMQAAGPGAPPGSSASGPTTSSNSSGGGRTRSSGAGPGRGGAAADVELQAGARALGRLLQGTAQRLGARDDAGLDAPAAVHSVWALVKLGFPVGHGLLARLAQELQRSHVCSSSNGSEESSSTGTSSSSSSSSSRDGLRGADPAHADGGAAQAAAVDDTLLAQFVWACSVASFQPRALLDAYCNALCARLRHPDLKPPQAAAAISSAALALSAAKHLSPQALQAIAAAAAKQASGCLSPAQTAALLHGLAVLGFCPRVWWQHGLSRKLCKDFGGMTLQELAHVLWAMGQWPLASLVRVQQLQLLRASALAAMLKHLPAQPDTAAPPPPASSQGAAAGSPPSPPLPPSPPPPPSLGSASGAAPAQVTSASSSGPPGAAGPQGLPAPATAPPPPPQPQPQLLQQPQLPWSRPPLSPTLLTDLAVGLSQVGVYSVALGDALVHWALSQRGPRGACGLSCFSDRQLCTLLWACAKWRHDALPLFEEAGRVLVARAPARQQQQQQRRRQQGLAAGAARAHTAADAGRLGARALTPRDLHKLLWAWAKLNRHPGAELLEVIRSAWQQATEPEVGASFEAGAAAAAVRASAASNGPTSATPIPGFRSNPTSSSSSSSMATPFPTEACCTMLYSLAILREHSSPLNLLLSKQLAALHMQPYTRPPSKRQPRQQQQPQQEHRQQDTVLLPLQDRPDFHKQAKQVAAAMLAARAEGKISPLQTMLPVEAGAAAMLAWQQAVRERSSKKVKDYQRELWLLVRKMGMQAQPNVVTSDGVACPDLIMVLASSPGLCFALELVGSQNSATNTGRLLGDAALKYRLLQARGYLVVPISCKEWDRFGPSEAFSKMLYIQAKLEKRKAALAAANAAAAVQREAAGLSGEGSARVEAGPVAGMPLPLQPDQSLPLPTQQQQQQQQQQQPILAPVASVMSMDSEDVPSSKRAAGRSAGGDSGGLPSSGLRSSSSFSSNSSSSNSSLAKGSSDGADGGGDGSGGGNYSAAAGRDANVSSSSSSSSSDAPAARTVHEAGPEQG